MAITFEAGTPATTTAAPGRSNNGDITVSFPAGYTPTAGHLAIIILYSDQGSGSVPADWTEITGSPFGAGTEKLQIFYKILVGGESDPITTISGSGVNISHCANMAIYSDVDTTNPIDTIGSASNGTGTPMTATGFDPVADNAMALHCCGRGDNEVSGSQSFGGSTTDVTERLDGGTNAGSDSQVSMADKLIATGSTGDASSDTSATDPWVSVIIALKPLVLTLIQRNLNSNLEYILPSDQSRVISLDWNETQVYEITKNNILNSDFTFLVNINRAGNEDWSNNLNQNYKYNASYLQDVFNYNRFASQENILDDFNRADGFSPPSSSWTKINWGGTGDVVTSGNNITTTAPTVYSNIYWNQQTFGPDCDIYATIANLVYGQPDQCGLVFRATPTEGYAIVYNVMIGVTPSGRMYACKVSAGGQTLIGGYSSYFIPLVSGDKIGARVEGDQIKGFIKRNVNNWQEIITRTDSTYTNAGYVGVQMYSNSGPPLNFARLDDFGVENFYRDSSLNSEWRQDYKSNYVTNEEWEGASIVEIQKDHIIDIDFVSILNRLLSFNSDWRQPILSNLRSSEDYRLVLNKTLGTSPNSLLDVRGSKSNPIDLLMRINRNIVLIPNYLINILLSRTMDINLVSAIFPQLKFNIGFRSPVSTNYGQPIERFILIPTLNRVVSVELLYGVNSNRNFDIDWSSEAVFYVVYRDYKFSPEYLKQIILQPKIDSDFRYNFVTDKTTSEDWISRVNSNLSFPLNWLNFVCNNNKFDVDFLSSLLKALKLNQEALTQLKPNVLFDLNNLLTLNSGLISNIDWSVSTFEITKDLIVNAETLLDILINDRFSVDYDGTVYGLGKSRGMWVLGTRGALWILQKRSG